MKEISIFDVIGPNMIGPSSSHTAGALRIALVVHKLAPNPIKEVTFILYGSFAKTYKGHGTDKALVAGILGMNTEDERIKYAFEHAKANELVFDFQTIESHGEVHPNTVEIIAKDEAGEETKIMGASIGGGNIRIDQINGVDVEFTGEYITLMIKQQDAPGVIAHIAQVLTNHQINIAFMKLYRESKGSFAYTMIELDDTVNEGVVEQLKEHPHIISVTMIKGI